MGVSSSSEDDEDLPQKVKYSKFAQEEGFVPED
jgi:hypothetical protein